MQRWSFDLVDAAPLCLCALGGLIIVLIALAGYLFSGFLLDDTLHLERITTAPWPGNIACAIEPNDLRLHLPVGVESADFNYHRPLTGLSLLIDHRLFGPRPLGFHLVNVMMHLINVWLAFGLGRRLGLSPKPALAAAVMWGSSVPAGLAAGWISGRTEVLAALCVLAAHHGALRFAETGARRWLIVLSVLLLLGISAKESAAVAPALIVVFLLAKRTFTPTARQPSRALQVALWAPVIAGLTLRFWLVGLPQIPLPYFQPPTSLAAVQILVLKLLVYLTGGLTGIPVIPFIQIATLQEHWPATLLVALLVTVSLRVVCRSAPGRSGLLLLAWFALALLPALLVMAFSFYLYLPLLGICWLLAAAWQKKRSNLIRGWMFWLTGTGLLVNLILAVCLSNLNQSSENALTVLNNSLAAGGVEDVVFIDAPFWSYSLPSAARLHDRDLSFHSHYLNFSSSLGPALPCRTRWINDRELRIAKPEGGFFASPIERFFLFGGDPCLDPGPGRLYSLTCQDGNPPTALLVNLNRSAVDTSLVLLQFDGWRLCRLTPPSDRGSAAPSPQ